MGSWLLSKKSIDRGPENIQLASTVAVLDTISVFMNYGLPSHSWIHGSSLENYGVRVKWPNDVWLRTSTKIGKLCGILVEGRTQGDDVQIILGIGLNKTAIPELTESIGWDELFSESIEDLIPVIHASVASLLEVHAMIDDYDAVCVMSSIFTSMRMTLSEGVPLSYGLDDSGGLQTHRGVVRTTGEIQWTWT
jgi:biotin-(acetyl-CoA carboxylase) ligase